MQVSVIIVAGANLQSVFQDVEWNKVAIVGVVVVLVWARWFSGFKNDPEIAFARRIDLALARPPVKRLLVMGPRRAPVHLIASRPEKIGERFMGFGPDKVTFVVFIISADQFLEL